MRNYTTIKLLFFLLCGSVSAFTNTHHLFGARQVGFFYSGDERHDHDALQSSSSIMRHIPLQINMARDSSSPTTTATTNKDENITKSEVAKEVQELLARAKAIRDSLPDEATKETQNGTAESRPDLMTSDGTDDSSSDSDSGALSSVGYRLYIDIGREDGTWMDPKWGASGRRIETSIDVDFLLPDAASIEENQGDLSLAGEEIVAKMVKDNLSGKSSAVRILNSSSARLRGGFDKMSCHGGGYRIDAGKGGRSASSTSRFYIEVDGTEEGGGYGDISIPKGCLYFSLPCFNNSMKQLSSKEGIVTVRQMGWHTGWRREESRIVGVFRAVPIEQARKRDRY